MRQLKITKSITNRESASLDKYLQEIGRKELITVDEDAMKNAFKFNPNVFSGLDLSCVAGSLSNFNVDASAMEAIDLAGIAKQINVDVSTDGINQMVSALVNAYMAQVSPTIDPENPPDMNTLLTGFVNFAMSGQGQSIMAAHAGNIVKEAAKLVGGGGGGRPNMAQAGGKNPAGIKDALDKAVEVLKNQIK